MYQKAKKRTIYFIGVTTSKSSIMKVFPKWADYLELGDVEIKGMDFKVHDEPEKYREAVNFIKYDELSLGALVTTHKVDLLRECKDQFDELDEYAELMDEISCISKRDGKLIGHAKDPITSGLSLDSFIPKSYWKNTGSEVLILGAGGSGIAISWYLLKKEHGGNRPSKIIVTNRSQGKIDEIKKIHNSIGIDIPVEYYSTLQDPDLNDRMCKLLKPGSLVINATGLGKDAPGSPFVHDKVTFPRHGIAWDFNYRGNLIFLDQAKEAKSRDKSLRIEDGWVYFIHGWTHVISEVFDITIPTEGSVFKDLSDIAATVRQ
tara:strand:+ start:5344 stop:6297 length:954 start_codon:yes stop_codon:yes gene_type:complete